MAEVKSIHPENLHANGIWNHFTGRKKYDIECGSCGYVYSDKVNFKLSNRAKSICPGCGVMNEWMHSEFAASYDRMMEEIES